MIILDPTGQPAMRPTTPQGKTVGFISNGLFPRARNVSSAMFLASLTSSGDRLPGLNLIDDRSVRWGSIPDTGDAPSPISAGAAHRAVCTTQLQLNVKASPP